MTVMPSSSDVADKAVSTEDAIASGCGGGGPVEMARLEAVLAALVENKVEAMKHDSALEAAALKAKRRRAGSVPVSPTAGGRNRSRLTSSSTLSSDQHHHHHGKHHHHHHHHHHPHGDKRGRRHRHRRHDSAPCGDYIEDPHKHRHGGREKSQSVDSPGRHHHDRRRHSRPPPHHPHHRPPNPAATLPPPPVRETIVSETTRGGGDPRFELLGINDADLAAIKLEHLQQSRQALSDTHEYATAAAARIHQSACYISHSAAQLKSHYDEDDYLTLQYADEIDDDDDDDEDDSLSLDVDLEAARASVIDPEGRAGAANNNGEQRRPPTGRRPPRRKRKRRKRRRTIVDVEGIELEMEDPDDLPPRARWTIVATACLLLVMSLLLVGVTLRMAPIIDEMGDGRRSSTCKRPSTGSVSGGQSNRTRRASNAAGAISSHRRDSVRPTRSPSGQLLEPASLEALQQLHSQSQKKKHSRQEDLLDDLEKNDGEEEDERSPRQRRIASILLGTFLFILAASVLAVVVTLTHSSFHQPPIGSRELQEHRANVYTVPSVSLGQIHDPELGWSPFRKENEELLNSLNRDHSVPVNASTTTTQP